MNVNEAFPRRPGDGAPDIPIPEIVGRLTGNIAPLCEHLLPNVNLFGYCQVASAYGSGNFINVLREHLGEAENMVTSRVNTKDDIYDSIKAFFAKGR